MLQYNNNAEHLSTQINEVVTDSNVAYEDTKLDVRMEENTAYKPTVIPASHNAAYAGVGRSQDEIEKQDAYEFEDTKLDVRMEENTAYKPTVIPVSHNAAYAGVGRSQDEIEKQDDYDYI